MVAPPISHGLPPDAEQTAVPLRRGERGLSPEGRGGGGYPPESRVLDSYSLDGGSKTLIVTGDMGL
jgi:hypothetical protein